jgi:hypothetical protein
VAFVRSCEHDVFVSYAHIDNERGGWVTKLVKELEIRLAEQLGGHPRPSVWIDHQISGNEGLQQTFEAIQRAATLLLIHSPSYLKSKWCRDELLSFVATRNAQGNRVFVVRTWPHDAAQERAELRDLPGYDFWTKDARGITSRLGTPEAGGKGRKYGAALNRLAAQVAEALKQAAPGDAGARPEAAMPRVFLAELPDDALEAKRTQVEQGLRQARVEVLPQDPDLVADLVRFESWALSVLPNCDAFVQLLSASSGKTRAFPRGLPALQYQLAVQAGVAQRIQWRDMSLALDSVANEEHRRLLQDPSVRTGGVQELIGEILKLLAVKQGVAAAALPNVPSVLVTSDLCDRALGERVEQRLLSKGLVAALPPTSAQPREVRDFMRERLLNWDAAFIVHRDSQWTWVNEQINQVVEKNLFRGMLTPPRGPAAVALLKARKTNGDALDADVADLATYEVGEDAGDHEIDAVVERFVQRLTANGPRAV